MRKIIKLYICLVIVLGTMTGYAQDLENGGNNNGGYGGNSGGTQLNEVVIINNYHNPIVIPPGPKMYIPPFVLNPLLPYPPVITGGGTSGGGGTQPKPPTNPDPKPDPKPDPCAEIKKALADAQFKAMMTELESPATLNKHNETGYWQDNKGVYHPMEINGIRAVKMPADMSTMENFTHVHMNDWKDPVTGVLEDSYPMPSPADIAKVYALGYNSLSNGLNLANTYVGNTSYLGSFQMRFVGNPDSLSAANFVKIYDAIVSTENEKAYIRAMNKNEGIEGLLAFLRDTLKTTDIAIYKIEATGASKVELDANNQITKTPCN